MRADLHVEVVSGALGLFDAHGSRSEGSVVKRRLSTLADVS